MSFKKGIKRCLNVLRKIILGFFLLSVISAILFRFVPVPFTPLMLLRVGQQLMDGKPVKMQKHWMSIDAISPNLPLAVVASEDQLFTEHHGFDFKAIEKAMVNNEKKKKKSIRGASTISQQTAKNVFLVPWRNFVRKVFEAYFTLLIEVCWNKERIMEVYLNVIETGDGIYGAEAASQVYFHKPAKNLSRGEAALIATVLPNPLRWSPTKATPYIHNRQQWILKNMNNLESVDFE